MYLFLAFLNDAHQQESAAHRMGQFGLGDPFFIRARSAAAVLSAEVPVFAGLKSLALGADEDRLILAMLVDATEEEANRLLARVQLEMDADDPPMGRLIALPVMTPPKAR